MQSFEKKNIVWWNILLSAINSWSRVGGGLIETGGLLNLETTIVSVLHKELEGKVEKLNYKKF